jgi:hypothetical protein
LRPGCPRMGRGSWYGCSCCWADPWQSAWGGKAWRRSSGAWGHNSCWAQGAEDPKGFQGC